jgi:polyhydroxybutyrate depolymerase
MAWQGVFVAGDANRREPARPTIVARSYSTFRPIAYRCRVGTGRIRIGLLLAILAAAVTQLASALPGAAEETVNPCQQAPTPGNTQVALMSGGVERTANLHVPPAAAGQRLPVVIGLHGAGGKFFESYSGFSVLADAEHFIAVYPNPIDKYKGNTFWDISSSLPGGGPDVQFLANLLDYLESNLCVDTSRVYAAGVSNGGGMAARAACELSSRFAAIASIAGGYKSLPPCQPANPVSVIEVHGTSDTVVPYNGSPPNGAGAVRPWLQMWGERDGCQGQPTVGRIAPRVERYEWTGCAEGAAIEHIEIFGGGHQLPGGIPPDAGQTSTVSATWLAWNFLRQHTQAAPYSAAAPLPGTPGPLQFGDERWKGGPVRSSARHRRGPVRR